MAKPNKKPKTTTFEDKVVEWRANPLQFVEEVFEVKPDAWQAKALTMFPTTPRMAMKACKGPGKSCLLAWIGWNFLVTRPHPMIGATSISGANLKANLWTEMARWRAKSKHDMLPALFEQTDRAIFMREHPKTWKMEARTWAADADAAQIGNALAGVHADYVMWLADESGDYPEALMPTLEAIFAGSPKEAHIVQAGNPTRLEGPLYRACTVARALWALIEITADPDNPDRTPRVSVEHAREQIAQYGRENPWVLVNIFGQFPPSSLNALIGPDAVEASMKRFYREHDYRHSPRVLGVDVARYGDDSSIIFPRQGIQAFPPQQLRNVDSIQGAGAVARKWADWGADACFIDNSGGFGSGWIDALRLLGRSPVPVDYSGEPQDRRYYNKRAEMYFNAVAWIKEGGALPEVPEIVAALSKTTYTFKGERLILEPKDVVKSKLGYSPDHADAFVETFHSPVSAPSRRPAFTSSRTAQPKVEYDPFAILNQKM